MYYFVVLARNECFPHHIPCLTLKCLSNTRGEQCSKDRPICRLISQFIVNRWVSDTITTYQSDLSPRPIYQCDSRYFGQNILNFATHHHLVADLSVREMIFGPIVLYSLYPHLIDMFCYCPSGLLVSINTEWRE
jgi:hypothetical protein